MNSPPPTALLLFTLCLILISSSHSANGGRPKGVGGVPKGPKVPKVVGVPKPSKDGGPFNIDEFCGGVDPMYKPGCFNLVRTNPQMANAKNYFELSRAILEFAANKATEGQKYLKGLAAGSPSEAIKQCAGFDYDGVVGSFKSALGELNEDNMTANYDAKVAGDGSDACNRGLADEVPKVNHPQVEDLNRQISLLSHVAFLATNKLPSSLV